MMSQSLSLTNLFSFLSDVPRIAVLVLALDIVVLGTCLDFATGYQGTVVVSYLLPVLLVTWGAGRAWGSLFALSVSLVATILNVGA